MTRCPQKAPRGTVIIIVLWAIAITALVASAVQLSAFRQAELGHEAVGRTQARWAARAGVEATIAVMSLHTHDPINPMPPLQENAFALVQDLENVAAGQAPGAVWDIRYNAEGRDWAGPMDEHSKFNINAESRSMIFELLEGMSIDIIAEINDWVDEDDEVTPFGAERDFYLSQVPPYQPRNGLLRSTAELELVAGIWPDMLRGDDWNLNNRLDPNEDDGDRSFPPDEANGQLDGAWYANLTVYSTANGAAASRLPRLYLRRTAPEELMDRLAEVSLDEEQALWLIQYGRNKENKLTDLALPTAAMSSGQPQDATGSSPVPLTLDQIEAVINECSIEGPAERLPGKININTVPEQLLRDLLIGQEILAEEILYLRNSRAEGVTSVLDLLEIRDVDQQTWEQLTSLFTTSSNVFTITSRGRSEGTGLEVEIIAVLDRSTVPIQILEYREQ